MNENDKLKTLECENRKLKVELTKCENERITLIQGFTTERRNVTWIAIGSIVQFLVCIGIFLTAYLTKYNVDLIKDNIIQQGEFNRNLLKPWAYVTPAGSIFVKNDTMIHWRYHLKCFGSSPALKVHGGSLINLNRNSPFVSVDTTGQYIFTLEYTEEDVETYLFPGEKEKSVDRGRKLSDLKLSKKNIKKKIDEGHQLYYHLFVEYQDCDKNIYFVDATLLLFDIEIERQFENLMIYEVKWVWIDVEHDIKKPADFNEDNT